MALLRRQRLHHAVHPVLSPRPAVEGGTAGTRGVAEKANAPPLSPKGRGETDGKRRAMFNQIDRLLIIGYFKSYFICLISLLSLYVVVDLFMNLEDFAHHGDTLPEVLTHIAIYYGYRITNIYDRLSEAIVLLAAMFTVAWMQ